MDIEDFEYRQEFDFGFFLFEFLSFDFEGYTPPEDDSLLDIFLSDDSTATDVLRYLLNAERNTGALIDAQSLFRSICEFCLDMDYDEHPLEGLSAQQKWYILSKSGEYTDLREWVAQFLGLSERTIIVQSGELFYSDSLLHADSGEVNRYFEEPAEILALIEKYRIVPIETLKIYETDSLFGLLYAEFWSMVTGSSRIRKCKFCGKYFIPYSENSEYCSRMLPDKNKSCKDYAPMVIFRRRIAEDELRAVYKKAEAAHYMRHKRNPTLFTLEQYDEWREHAKEALENARREGTTVEELKRAIKK
ncbi:MAG: DUF6076 domain-containing protein [Oscillospiraceae bacterium]|nr:DUF6076 domain-containing protein [Oscillospiraceae bacterium]